MKEIDLLKDLTLLPGVPGNEKCVRNFMEKELEKYTKNTFKDNTGSIAFEFKGEKSNPKVLLIGHMDEIGFMVHSITKSGLIKFIQLGGWDARSLMSSPVEIINTEGKRVFGLIGSVPVHHLGDSNTKLSIEDLIIDIGADSDVDVEKTFKIRKGDFIVPVTSYYHIKEKDYLVSKAFDDRVGIAIAIETGKYFAKEKHPNILYCAGSAQEEVGCRGATTIANLVKPDLAIVVEGAPGDDFPSNKDESQAKRNAGVQIRMIDPTMIANKEFINFVIKTAEKLKIPYQIAVRKSGGTDAGKIHLADMGVPTVVLSAPVRYAHSHNNILSIKDYKAVRDLAIALIKILDTKTLKKIMDN
jgi:endoglucanase